MGAAATPLAFGEIYTALQAGVLDGLEHDPPTILASKFYETAKNYSLTEHNFSALGVFCSAATLNRMAAPLREPFLAAAAKAAADTRVRGLEAQKEAMESLKQKGVTIIAVDKEPFRQRVLPQTDAFMTAHPEVEADHRDHSQHPRLTLWSSEVAPIRSNALRPELAAGGAEPLRMKPGQDPAATPPPPAFGAFLSRARGRGTVRRGGLAKLASG